MAIRLPGRRVRAHLASRREARRTLRRPSGFRIAIADTIAQLDRDQWDDVVDGESWFFSRAYLAMLERVPPAVVEPRYALISDAQGPVAAVVLQWAEVDSTRLRPLPKAGGEDDELNPLRRLVDKLSRPARAAFASRLRERVLVCGNLLTYGQHAVAVAPDVEPDSVWPAVAEVLYRVRRAEKLAGQAGLALRAYTPTGALARRTHALYLGVHANAGLRPFTLHPDDFAELAATAGDRVRFSGLFAGPDDTPEALRGFIVTLADVDEALGYHIGFEQPRTNGDEPGLPLYLRLLHASIADAIAHRARTLSFGRTALEPKARLGAKPQEMQVWLRHRQPVFNQIVRLVGFAHHAEAPDTNPFKKG